VRDREPLTSLAARITQRGEGEVSLVVMLDHEKSEEEVKLRAAFRSARRSRAPSRRFLVWWLWSMCRGRIVRGPQCNQECTGQELRRAKTYEFVVPSNRM
jgi:hypothetical protein